MRKYLVFQTPYGDFGLDMDELLHGPRGGMPDYIYEVLSRMMPKLELPSPDEPQPKTSDMKEPMGMATLTPPSMPKAPRSEKSESKGEASASPQFTIDENSRFKDTKVVRTGDQIILPDEMTYREAHYVLHRQEEAEEKIVSVCDVVQCYPLDGIVALMRALKEIYGFTFLDDSVGFMGMKIPPTMMQVPLHDGKFETAVLGRIAPPKWEGGFLETNLSPLPELIISGEIKRKFEPEVKRIITLARKHLLQGSIYRGRAISVDLSFMGKRPFDANNDAPKFMDVDNVDESALILNDVTDFELRANIFTLVEQTEACLRNRIPLKHGCLLMGPYGTGKTMTANVLAHKCVRNKWTFIYLKNAAHLEGALRLAQMYAPAVVFSEDIDQVMTGGRNEAINKLLNTLDGVDTKGKPIITILTTNHPEKIEPAFLRAGRIDTIISMDAPDAKTSIKFIHKFARDDSGESLLVPNEDLTQAGVELAGFAPAFINEAIQKAKRFAIHREGEVILGKVTCHDLVLAAQALKKHNAMVNRKTAKTDEQLVARAVEILHEFGENGSIVRENGEAVQHTTEEDEETAPQPVAATGS